MCCVGAGGCVQEHACSHPYISHTDSASFKRTAGEAEGRCGAAFEGDQSQLNMQVLCMLRAQGIICMRLIPAVDGESEESCCMGKAAGAGQEEGGGGSREGEE